MGLSMQDKSKPVDPLSMDYDAIADANLWKALDKEAVRSFKEDLIWEKDALWDNYAFSAPEWDEYYKDHQNRWGYDEKSGGHRFEVRAQFNNMWKTFKFFHRVDAVAELKKLLSNNICAIMSEIK